MEGHHTPIQTLSIASITEYTLTPNEASKTLQVDLAGYSKASITVRSSADLAITGAVLFSVFQGNEKGKVDFPIVGVVDIPSTPNSNEGRFDIDLSGRYLKLQSTPFILNAGRIIVTIMAKR